VAGRFPLYTDADVDGPVVEALAQAGWDVERAVDTFPEGTEDPVHFAHAATAGRALVSNDLDMKLLAQVWYEQRSRFVGLVWWSRRHYEAMSAGDFVDAFEDLARQDDPFASYPIVTSSPSAEPPIVAVAQYNPSSPPSAGAFWKPKGMRRPSAGAASA
jgi:hypothetical protein